MFVMTSDIRIGQYRSIKANSVTWKCGTGNFTDTCAITLPLSPYVRKQGAKTGQANGVMETNGGAQMKRVNSVPFKRGDEVVVALGYDQRNVEVFRGYVLKVNFADNMVIECEGYAYLLREKYFTKSYEKTTLKKILMDLTAGTGIKLSPRMDDVPLSSVWFKNSPALKVLEWVQKELCCRVFFDGEYLYAGASKFVYADPTRSQDAVKLRVGLHHSFV